MCSELLPREVEAKLRLLMEERGSGQLVVDVFRGSVAKAKVTETIEWTRGTKVER